MGNTDSACTTRRRCPKPSGGEIRLEVHVHAFAGQPNNNGPWTELCELEQKQIENELHLSSMISLTEHDNIEAPLMLRLVREFNADLVHITGPSDVDSIERSSLFDTGTSGGLR